MKGVGKRKTTSEMSNDASGSGSAAAAAAAVEFGVVDGGVQEGAPSFAEAEHTQLQGGEMEEPHVVDSEEEEEAADDDEDEEQEEQEEHADQVAVPGQRRSLAEGFFEIEGIRGRRIRKGKRQYLIKWREWPDSSNTWEPVENLESIADVVAAYDEESLKSGKKKRKRKPVVHHIQPKKRLERSATPYSLRRFPANTPDNNIQSAPPNDHSIPDMPAFPQTVLFADEVENNGDARNLGTANHAHDNMSADAPEAVIERNEENDYDPKLSELRATTTNGHEGERVATQVQETQHSIGTHHADGQLNGDCTEPVQSGRCRGAKRRKSGTVKRFNKDSYPITEPANTQRPVDMTAATTELAQTGAADNAGQNGLKRTNHARPAKHIVKIIKPVGYSAVGASSMQDCLVTFVALRSDGAEVLVDNNFLKNHYPILLINFYEQHLRYTAAHD